MSVDVANITPEKINLESIQAFAEAVIGRLELPLTSLGVILVDDPFLCRLHKQYLDDPTPTDIITFDLSEPDSEDIEAELYISVERARAHAAELQVPFSLEIARLVVHGILHLQGFQDHTPGERAKMRSEEDRILALFPGLIDFET